MDIVTILIGTAALVFGIYTLYARQAKPESFGKLEAMRKVCGPTAGTIIHVVAYSVVPIVFGLVAVCLGILGRSIL